MDPRASAEQQHRSGGGTSVVDKVSPAETRARRPLVVKAASSSHLMGGDRQQEQAQAIDLLSSEIATVVRQQEEVHRILRRKGGVLKSLSDRVKSAIRGTDGEHDLRELRCRLKWLRKKEVQLREEKLLLLLKDVSSQPSLHAPGAVAAAVAAAATSAAETSVARLPPTPLSSTPSKRRLGFRRSASSSELSGGARSGGVAVEAVVKGKENRGRSVWSKSSKTQPPSRRTSFGRSAPSPPPPPPPSPPPPAGAGAVAAAAGAGSDAKSRQRMTGAIIPRQPEAGVNASGTSDRGATSPAGRTAGAHISSYKRAHLMARGGEAYLALSSEHQHQQYQSTGGNPASGVNWRRPIAPHGYDASLNNFRTAPATFVGPTEPAPVVEIQTLRCTGATAAVEGVDAPPPAKDLETPPEGSRGWPSQASRLILDGAEVASEMESEGSPPRLTRTRSATTTKRTKESAVLNAAAVAFVMGGESPAGRENLPTVSSTVRNNATNRAPMSANSSLSRLRPAAASFTTAAAAPSLPLSGAGTGPGGGDQTGVEVRRPRAATCSGVNEYVATASARGSKAAAGECSMFSSAPAKPAVGTEEEEAGAKASLERGPSSGSFEAPSEMERLVPIAGGRDLFPPAVSTGGGTTTEDSGALVASRSTSSVEPPGQTDTVGSVTPPARDAEDDTGATASPPEAAEGVGEKAANPPPYDELVPVSYAAVTALALNETRETDSSTADATGAASPSPVLSAATTAERTPSALPASAASPRYRQYYGKHPLAGMRDLLSSCFALLDATDGNSNLPEALRKEMKMGAIAAARKAEIAEAVSLETPPSVWVSQYEDMSKKYGLGFLLSSGSSGVAFKDGTKIALDSGGHVFEYVDRVKGGGSKRSNSSEQITSREPSTTTTESSAAAAAAALARRRSRHYGGEDSRSGSGGELQQQKQSQKQQRWLEELPRIVHSLDDYPDRFVKKVVIAQKIRKLLQRAAIAEEDSAAGSTVSATSPVGGASPRDVAAAATAAARSRVDVGGGSAADDGGVPGGAAVVERVQKARGGSATPFIFVEDWKRTRSSWIFRLSNRTVQAIFLDATEIVLTEEARLITYADRGGRRETIALLRALEEERMDVIVRVRECYSLIKKLIAYDEERVLAKVRRK